MKTIEKYIRENRDRIEKDLQELVSQKSVSPTGEGIGECAELVSEMCLEYGFEESRIIETGGHPAVIASRFVEEDRPTVVLYGHYDVQPVEEAKWTKNPFDASIEKDSEGNRIIHARGVGDNKAQFFAHLCAVESLESEGKLETNVVIFLEGEEETGSPNLSEAVEKAEILEKGDILICADGPKEVNDLPVVELGCRGVLYISLTLRTGERNLHSGEYGGLERNASLELADLISSIKDRDYEVSVEGFYENVREPEQRELDWIEELEQRTGYESELDLGRGEGMEKIFLYPNLNFSGIKSGFGGEGVKTIIPSEASTNIGVRMVADQTGEKVFSKIRSHVEDRIPPDVELEIENVACVNPYITDRESKYIDKIVSAVDSSHEENAVIKPVSSATLPFETLNSKLDIECVKIPYANSDENNHSPDEKMKMDCFYTGISTTAEILEKIKEDKEN